MELKIGDVVTWTKGDGRLMTVSWFFPVAVQCRYFVGSQLYEGFYPANELLVVEAR